MFLGPYRPAAIATAAALVPLTAFAIVLAPEVWPLIVPAILRRHPSEGVLLVPFAGYAYLKFRRSSPAGEALWDRWERRAGRFLRGPIRIGLALVCAGFLATWLPHYPTWPWNRDHDTFAALAQLWDAGVRPYRDARVYNFPGQIYVFWVLGKTLGWGWSPAFFALDAIGLAAFGIVLIAWSRRLFGDSTAGWLGFLLILEHYLDLGHFQTAERDWQTALSIAIGLALVESRPKRSSRLALAALAAAALALRPHAALFFPAIVSALDASARSEGKGGKGSLAAIFESVLAFSAFSALLFSPLIVQGLIGDLARSLREVASGGYGSLSPAGVARAVLSEAAEPFTLIPWLAIAVCSIVGSDETRRSARTWTLAFTAAIVYKPIHPVPHDYLGHPLALARAVAIAAVVGNVLRTKRLSAIVRSLFICWVLFRTAWCVPSKCDPSASLRAIADLARGGLPEQAPIGCDPWYMRPGNAYPKGDYPWRDYRAAVLYLQARSRRDERVANLLRRMPFPPINGVVGRLDVFPVESGIAWLWMRPNDRFMEPFLASELERTADSWVVWEPDDAGVDPRMALREIGRVVRERYEVAARFGRLEVLKRRRNPPESGDESIAPR